VRQEVINEDEQLLSDLMSSRSSAIKEAMEKELRKQIQEEDIFNGGLIHAMFA
jgi:hypothetical protein